MCCSVILASLSTVETLLLHNYQCNCGNSAQKRLVLTAFTKKISTYGSFLKKRLVRTLFFLKKISTYCAFLKKDSYHWSEMRNEKGKKSQPKDIYIYTRDTNSLSQSNTEVGKKTKQAQITAAVPAETHSNQSLADPVSNKAQFYSRPLLFRSHGIPPLWKFCFQGQVLLSGSDCYTVWTRSAVCECEMWGHNYGVWFLLCGSCCLSHKPLHSSHTLPFT